MRRCQGSTSLRLDRIPIRTSDPIRIQKYGEVLVRRYVGREYGDRHLGLIRDLRKLRDYFADRHLAGIRCFRVVWSVEEDRDEIRRAGVLTENRIYGRDAGHTLDGSKDLRAQTGAETYQPRSLGVLGRGLHLDYKSC
jgi:hypothetical protein